MQFGPASEVTRRTCQLAFVESVGFAEFVGRDTRIDMRRVRKLAAAAREIVDVPAAHLESEVAVPWAGLRPMSVDGVPIIGACDVENLYFNSGHGQMGWTLAAGSGRLAADAVLGRNSTIDASPYGIARFSRQAVR